jgi:hypothetical protein
VNFSQWLKANNYDEAALSEAQKKHLEAAWKAETQAPPPTPEPTFDKKMEAIDAENERQTQIRELTLKAVEANVGNTEKCKTLRSMCDAAVKDNSVTVDKFRYQLTCADRMLGAMVITPSKPQVNEEVLEAAVCVAGGLENIDKHFSDQTLSIAKKEFKHGLGLHGLVGHCARRNGYTSHDFKSDWYRAVKAAFSDGSGGGHEMYAAATGPSTYSLPNILSNVANKFLRVGFLSVDSSWRLISAVRSFNDFKTATTAALTGSLMYKKLPPSGEIKHGTIGEIAYTNKADTYAVMLGIDRQSLINDDLGALTTVGRRMGRGAALSLNDAFWTVFLNNSSFFTAGNNNVSTGAGSALATADGAAINAAEVKFRNQTDPDGKPLGSMPKIMLVPPTLNNTGARWMGSQLFVGSTGLGDNNIFGGRYNVVTSAYMENSSYTGNSNAAWYLLADPNDLPVIEVGFLNGNESPTVETEAAEFNMLGIALRGYYDFGAALQEFRGGVRSAGS